VFSLLLAIKLLDEYLFSSGFSSVSNSTPVIEKSLPHSFTAFETPCAAAPRETFSFLDKVGSNPQLSFP
jgi:hypothetical protein